MGGARAVVRWPGAGAAVRGAIGVAPVTLARSRFRVPPIHQRAALSTLEQRVRSRAGCAVSARTSPVDIL